MDLNFPTLGGLRRLEDVSRSKFRTQAPGTQTLQKQKYKLLSPERLALGVWGLGGPEERPLWDRAVIQG